MTTILRTLVAMALAVATLAGVDVPRPPSASAADAKRPNIVFITTDDQRADDMEHMPFTRRLLGGHGYTFTGALSNHPLCCPARAEWLTGQYAQNNGVHHNGGRHGGFGALERPGNTIASWLDGAGYRTAMVGKFMNGYKGGKVGGWDVWNPTVRNVYRYEGTTFHNNGSPKRHAKHVDDVVSAYAAKYVRQLSGRRPFFIWASNLAPHTAYRKGQWRAPVPAVRHRGTKRGVKSPAVTNPAFNVKDGFNRKVAVDGDPSGRVTRRSSKRRHRLRLESLQAVDEGVRRIVRALRRSGELRNTYVMFMSDNGYLLGEHAIMGKNYLYAQSLRVPLLVRAPGVGRPRTSALPVTVVDVAPTLAELGGVTPRRPVDGASFAPVLRGGTVPWRDTQLIQTGRASGAAGKWATRGVLTREWMYAYNSEDGRQQLIHRAQDPHEQHNLADEPAYGTQLADLHARFMTLKDCSGASCRDSFGTVTGP